MGGRRRSDGSGGFAVVFVVVLVVGLIIKYFWWPTCAPSWPPAPAPHNHARPGRPGARSTDRANPIPRRLQDHGDPRRQRLVTTTTGTKAVAPKTVPPLAADLDAGLRRLKLATVRRTAPEVLQVAKTQRWTPEELLRTLIEAEIAVRDASNTANRLKAAAFPVIKTLEGFDVSASSIPQATFHYLSSLEWVRAQHNLAIVGPPEAG